MKKTPKKPQENAPMDMAEIERLIDLGEKKGLAEFEVEKSGVRVRIKYQHEPAVVNYGLPVVPPPAVEAPATTKESSLPAPAVTAEPSLLEAQDIFLVKSPIVGTFYAAPDPKTPPYVTVGQHVQLGQVLCIVEAMKLMNEIESEVAGEIVKVFVENAQPVEYGEPLFAIRTKS